MYLFTLLRGFDIQLAVAPEEILQIGTLVQRPNVRSEMEKGAQMPLLLRPLA